MAKTVEDYDPNMAARQASSQTLWHDVQQLVREGRVLLEGQGFPNASDMDPAHFYRRLPARAEGKVTRAVWHLCHHSAGLSICFQTDATQISADWKLADLSTTGAEPVSMNHMAATGVSGLDLYVLDERLGWRWLAVGRATDRQNRSLLVEGLSHGVRTFRLYLPLYNALQTLQIGLPADAILQPGQAKLKIQKPVVFYGSSITQGGCASRPGMAYTSILGRRLNCPTVNLGFSGSGKAEMAMAELVAQIDACAYVFDSLPNQVGDDELLRTEPFVQLLRARRPHAALVLMENLTYTNAGFIDTVAGAIRHRNEHLRTVMARLKDQGWKRLYYVDGGSLLGDDGEATVDGAHPSDLGFSRIAEKVAPTLQQAIIA